MGTLDMDRGCEPQLTKPFVYLNSFARIALFSKECAMKLN